MPHKPSHLVALLSASALGILSLSSVAQAAILRPLAIHRPGDSHLPTTPAYKASAVTEDFKALTSSPRAHTVDVVVDSPARIQALAAYSQAVSQPGSPDYHQFLTPQELDRAFGPTPAMIRQARASMTAAGWRVTGIKGLVATATVPNSKANPGLPVSPDIWSMSGLAPHGVIRRSAIGGLAPKAALSLAGENFHQPPVATQTETDAAIGDTVTVMSWNPNIKGSLPAGLPFNVFVTVQDPQGNLLPIQSISHVGDTANLVGYYEPQAMPGSSNTLWQVPLAAVRDVSSGDTLSLSVTLQSGQTLQGQFPLPTFTGSATALSPLDGQQLNTIAGVANPPAKPATVALFAIGTPPSLSDVTSYLDQNPSTTSAPIVNFVYADGASASEYGNSSDSEESQVDLEAVAGAAPGVKIQDFIFPENDAADPLISFLSDLSQQQVAKIASISYGFFGEDPATLTTLMNALTAEGVTVLEASGDQGAWDSGSDPGPVGLSSLEQIPSVLSVGGLDIAAPATLDSNGNTKQITGPAVVRAWGGDYLNGIPVNVAQSYTNADAASSGGYSTTTPVPSWQEGLLPSSAPGLGVPIISALAGYPALSGFFQGQNAPFLGTSVASPLTAGWLADVEADLGVASTGLGNLNPLLVKAAQDDPKIFTQALWGSNGAYSVTSSQPGTWNPVTGLGMVNWGAFTQDYNGLSPQTHPAVTLQMPGQSFALQPTTVSATATGMLNPRYEFWVEYPTGWWFWGGQPASKSSVSFRPSVPGSYLVRVKVTSDNGVTITKNVTLNVTSKTPMVDGLKLTSNPPWLRASAGSTVTFHAAAADTGTHPWYIYWLRGPYGVNHIVQGYAANSNLVLRNLKPGSYLVTAKALDMAQVQAKHWGQAFHTTRVLYVDSWVSALTPRSAPRGRLLTLRAAAHNITHPLYQFVVKEPNGTTISSPHNMARNFWSFIPSQPGTYHIIIYSKDGGAQQAISTSTAITVY
ncbi:protease pro-enzyme activation domain-containing protein [Sulfobacillus harzensis]|uniref:Peptidase S53 n=1 Tax=Sulfobacillus harzensis TaxID=2729629 RepID=A0A7Y0Q4I3_9FIRM|nr:protease pro-enzyme activation domain-containing protein [Sulfobacillus harzensis]NMP23284.1 peptidase S53 [Sulfobacillus harzensis]